ncbi:MAG: HAMP domain-containing protein [Desulfobulbaceae bacterium]|nr:HAMP domain-containing protein [Desulfobulbaceae bacterium]
MKKWFLNLSIRYKLYAIVIFACLTALLFALLFSFLSQRYLAQKQLVDEVRALAQVIAENSQAGISFEDSNALNTMLDSLGAKRQVLKARISDTSGTVLGVYDTARSYGREYLDALPSVPVELDKHRFNQNSLEVMQSVFLHNELIGSVYLLVSFTEVQEQLLQLAGAMTALLLLGLLLAMLLSNQLLALIFEPIRNLSQVMEQVSQKKRYDLRVQHTQGDELGLLSRVFNEKWLLMKLSLNHWHMSQAGIEQAQGELWLPKPAVKAIAELIKVFLEIVRRNTVKGAVDEFLHITNHDMHQRQPGFGFLWRRHLLEVLMLFANSIQRRQGVGLHCLARP